jgi:DNA repair exonuclease SbcCD ATPase subunit
MAQKREFLEALDEHASVMQRELEEISEGISTNKSAIRELNSRRTTRLGEIANELLPDINEGSIANVNRAIPNFTNLTQIRTRIEHDRADAQTRIARLQEHFNPDSYESERIGLETTLASAETDLKQIKTALQPYRQDDEVMRLVNSGYGTSAYPHKWYERQYYRDWSTADKAFAKFRKRDWQELASTINDLEERYATVQTRRDSIKRKLDQLNLNRTEHDHLKVELEQVPTRLLEMLRAQLQARLTTSPVDASLLGDIVQIDAQIAELEERNLGLQQNRTTLNDQITKLATLRSKAASSRTTQVPDEYLQQVRSSASRAGHRSSGSSYTNTVVQHYNSGNDWLTQAVLYDTIMDHFHDHRSSGYDQPAAYGGSSQQSRTDPTWAYAHNDRSGQS